MFASWVGAPGEGDGLGMRAYLFSLPAGLFSFLLIRGKLNWKKVGINALICIAVEIILGRINFHTYY